MERTQTPKIALLLSKAHNFVTLLQAHGLTVGEGLVLSRAVYNSDQDSRETDFNDRYLDQIAGFKEEAVWEAVISLEDSGLLYCCDPESLLTYNLTEQGRWVGVCAAAILNEAYQLTE